ncbi:thiopurine S-methyltransferase [Xanthobacter pseudotagetidis]|uniref:thiopurine S-methyltransferase n=1 Tax=Xanthobacter pseudotagetidis TaxID=3119911 RepID=UPI00372CE378
MDADFWHARWTANQIGFHEGKPNVHLEARLARLGLAADGRVFLPLCGKTRDIAWLLARGLRVAGAELSPLAVAQLFEELGVAPEISAAGPLELHRAPGLDVFVGDIFALSADRLGPVDAVYDRAALVALPPSMRPPYAAHLAALAARAPQLLVCFTYDQTQAEGPPFSVAAEEVEALYGAAYRLERLDNCPVPGGLRGKVPAKENVWLLEPA